MTRARVDVCSSTNKGLCNAIIEALGCGAPVVSTDCPYGPREILQGGRYGTLVPPGNMPVWPQRSKPISTALSTAPV